MPSNWTKGFTRNTHPSVKKISDTMKRLKIDNFFQWREGAKVSGIIKSKYPEFKKDGDLAELLGVVYGDGNIGKFPRTERLIVAANSHNLGFINRYAKLVKKIFNKEPKLMKSSISNCVRISVYEKNISSRLGIPSGNRGMLKVTPRPWILNDREILKRFLRGLYEAEGSFCIHKPTYTYKFLFANKNDSLLKIVYNGLDMLGFHPHLGRYQVQLSRKEEVYGCIKVLGFRNYK